MSIMDLMGESLKVVFGGRSMSFATAAMNAMKIASAVETEANEQTSKTWERSKMMLQELIRAGVLHTTQISNPTTGLAQTYCAFTEGFALREFRREPSIKEEDLLTTARTAGVLSYLGSCGIRINPEVVAFIRRNKDRYEKTDSMGRKVTPPSLFLRDAQSLENEEDDRPIFMDYKSPDNRRFYALHNRFTHQGAEWMRASVDAAEEKPIKPEDIDDAFIIVTKETGVTRTNWRAILKDESLCFTGKHLGLKTSKPAAVYRAAIFFREILEKGRSGYIIQQDQTCSGFQIIAMLLACRNLMTLTNLNGGEEQDFYTASSDLARGMYSGEFFPECLFIRSGAKYFVLRIGYGAATSSLARGLILANPQESPVQYLTEEGAFIPGVLDKLPIQDFNEDYYEMWKDLGWKRAVEVSQQTSKAYYGAIMQISPKLRWFLSSMKLANRIALERGEFLSWEPIPGEVKKNVRYTADWKAKPRKVQFFDKNGKEFYVNIHPFEKDAAASAAPPCYVHSFDGATIMLVVEMCKELGIPVFPIHDSIGTTVDNFKKVKEMWLNATRHIFCYGPSPFWDVVKKYNLPVPASLFPNGHPEPIDVWGEHFMG
jgi:hypothetical protein